MSLAESVEHEIGEKAELVRGDNRIFDVELDGRLVFSKHAVGRFPEQEEILAALRG